MHRSSGAVLFISATLAWSGLVAAQAASAPSSQAASESAATTGRPGLVRSLDEVAAGYTASRAVAVGAIHTKAQAEARRAMVRGKILSLIGAMPPRTPLNAKVTGETKADGFLIRKVIFESQRGFPVTALLYLPTGQSTGQKRPAILMTPGHSAGGKADDAGTAALFALNGFVVLSYDPIGQGERLQYPDPAKPGNTLATRATGEHGEASLQPMLIGETFTKYEIWDAMRGVDYLAQLPEVDGQRIGALGCSGGGAVSAMTSALDTRIAAIGVACFTTSFDTLLPSVGAQEGEQSIPRFVASGFDFPDWIELAAPRPYAVIATYSDMFPFAGARASVIEARRFYSIFDAASAGTPTGSGPASIPPTPTAPALNADTTNRIAPEARLQFITGPGRHGNLGPIMGEILSFFIRNLEPGTDADHPVLPAAYLEAGSRNPIAGWPKDARQVTATGQVSTSFPHSATVFSLNLKRAPEIIPAHRTAPTGAALAQAVREMTGAEVRPGTSKFSAELLAAHSGPIVFPLGDGESLEGDLAAPAHGGKHPAILLLVPDSIDKDNAIARVNKARFDALAAAGNVVLAMTPRPSPPGTDDMKSPLLGPFYLLSLRADITGRTLVGLRVDDVIRATDYLAGRPDVDAARISATGSGHMGIVLLHAAVLDSRISHVAIDHALASYGSLLDAPLPTGAPEDVLPGVLLHYDLPDLARALGTRMKEADPLKGTDDLSQMSTPLSSLAGAQP